jgi:hypothetical protein
MLIYSAAHSEMLNAFYKETAESATQSSHHSSFLLCEAQMTNTNDEAIRPYSDDDKEWRSELEGDESPCFGHQVIYLLRLALRHQLLPVEKACLVEEGDTPLLSNENY